MNSVQLFDLAVVGVLLYCAWKGAARGLVSQGAWVVALVLCFKFSGELAPVVEPVIAVDQPLKRWVSMAIVYLGLCMASFVAASMLDSWLVKARMKDFDRHLGAVLGLLKGVVICMTAMFFSLTLAESSRGTVSQTRSAYAAAVLLYHLDPLIPLIPEGAKESVEHVRETFDRRLNPDESLSGGFISPRDVFDDWQGGLPGSKAETPGDSGFRWPDLWGGSSTGGSSTGGSSTGGSEMTPVPGQGGGTSGTSATYTVTQLSRFNSAILDQIAGIYGDRQNVIARTTEFLAGVPEDVQRRVLEDWHADVMLLQNDPDPGTDVSTRLDERILRQLSRAGISLDRLDRDLRARLSQSVR